MSKKKSSSSKWPSTEYLRQLEMHREWVRDQRARGGEPAYGIRPPDENKFGNLP